MDSENNDTMLVDQPSLGEHTAALERLRLNVDDYQERIKKTEEERDAGYSSSSIMRETYLIAQSFDRVLDISSPHLGILVRQPDVLWTGVSL